MILKGSQRGNGADLAIHLMNGFDNERVEIAEVYGAVAGDLYGAFAEFEAVALGARAQEYLYSLSISPPARLTREQYYEAIAAIEHRLGLTDQPRAVVFHVKPDASGQAREHCHVVWSRIKVETMRAVHMAHDHRKLMDVACELAHKFGLELPPGLKAWDEKRKLKKDTLEPTLAETAQAAATGITAEQRSQEITAAYEAADSAEAFRAALEEKGYILARGDRRGYVVVDENGDVHSLSRYVKGHTASALKSRLAGLPQDQLPGVDQAKELIAQRARARADAQPRQDPNEQQQDQQQQEERAERRRVREEALGRRQAARRLEITKTEQEVLTRQQGERLALQAAQLTESRGLLFRVRSAVADLIGRTPGLRSVLAPLQKLTHLDPKERHRLEGDALARRHARERFETERQKRFLARVETRERRSLEKALRRDERLAEAARLRESQEAAALTAAGIATRQDFYDTARDLGLWKKRIFKDGELQEEFNAAAGNWRGGGADGEDEVFGPDTDPDDDNDFGDDGAPAGGNEAPEPPRFTPRRKRGARFKR